MKIVEVSLPTNHIKAKEFARIDRSFLQRIIHGFERRVLSGVSKECRFSEDNIPGMSLEQRTSFCRAYNCSENDQHAFYRTEKVSLTQSQILMMVGFHFLDVKPVQLSRFVDPEITTKPAAIAKMKEANPNMSESEAQAKATYLEHFSVGLIRNIRTVELADFFSMDVRTITRNLLRLQDIGFIELTKVDRGVWQIVLTTYYSKEQGYLKMSSEHLSKLSSMKDVNALRLSLRLYETYDRYELVRKSRNESHINVPLADLVADLPKYIRKSNRLVNKLFDKSDEIFTLSRISNHIEVDINERFHAKAQEAIVYQENDLAIQAVVEELSLPVYKQRDFSSLASLSMEFGLDLTEGALRMWSYRMRREAELNEDEIAKPISNIGGYIRSIIVTMSIHSNSERVA
ncbi:MULTISPECIES: hypothetical protein [unclassified Psychrobacillus]|uniref:hypothetical protein n=1 Tax=unclassified Psychrobacillus TaxID=2636677 RepID=UPI0030FB1FD4